MILKKELPPDLYEWRGRLGAVERAGLLLRLLGDGDRRHVVGGRGARHGAAAAVRLRLVGRLPGQLLHLWMPERLKVRSHQMVAITYLTLHVFAKVDC